MTTPPDVVVNHDLAVWLRGPGADADDHQIAEWVAGAQYAVATDLDLENSPGGAEYREYLHRVLTAFGHWQTPANLTFLRLRYQGDTPVPVGVELYRPEDVADLEADLDGRLVESALAVSADVPHVGEITCESVAGTGWTRLLYWVDDPDDGVVSRVRLVRTFPAGVVAILRAGGQGLAETMELLPDLDALAASITVDGQS